MVDAELFYGPHDEIVRSNVRILFTTPYAQAWCVSHKESADPTTVPIIDDEFESVSSQTAQELFDSIGSKLAE